MQSCNYIVSYGRMKRQRFVGLVSRLVKIYFVRSKSFHLTSNFKIVCYDPNFDDLYYELSEEVEYGDTNQTRMIFDHEDSREHYAFAY
mmetsp:Transcript_14810/g.25188  ORF Transcript_14810/g.25188 Transcript_14810/m.25188 type:complete len:88 (+) Transcript_14810:465-728(+)